MNPLTLTTLTPLTADPRAPGDRVRPCTVQGVRAEERALTVDLEPAGDACGPALCIR
jgi:hypothetical protein